MNTLLRFAVVFVSCAVLSCRPEPQPAQSLVSPESPEQVKVYDWVGREFSELVFPKDRESVEFPIAFGGTMPLLASVKINGQDVGHFLLDTGANVSLIDYRAADRMGLRLLFSNEDAYAVDPEPILRVYAVGSLSIGAVELRHHIIHSTDLAALRKRFRTPVLGILGGDFWGKMPFTVDLARARLTLHNPQTFRPPGPGFAVSLEGKNVPVSARALAYARANPNQGWPYVTVSVDGKPAYTLLDTGAAGSIDLMSGMIAKHPALVDRSRRSLSRLLFADDGESAEARVSRLTLFGETLTDLRRPGAFLGASPDSERSRFNAIGDAVIGWDILRRFVITFDYGRHRLWVKRQPVPTIAERLAGGLSPNSRDLRDAAPLSLAAYLGDLEGCRALLKAGADINQGDVDNETALMYAARGDQLEVASLLLEQPGVRVDQANVAGETALGMAARAASMQLCKKLIDAGASVWALDKKGFNLVHSAAMNVNHPDVVPLLVSLGVPADSRVGDITPLVVAALRGNQKAYEHLVGGGADAARSAGACLVAAIEGNRLDMVRYLVRDAKAKPDVNEVVRGGRPLVHAVRARNVEMVRLLLSVGARAEVGEASETTALHGAAMLGLEEIAGVLLDAGARVDALDQHGNTALILAAEKGRKAIVELLIKRGADVKHANVEGLTALYAAVISRRGDCIAPLVVAGTSPDAAGLKGDTPVHLAAMHGDAVVLRQLLDAGGGVNPVARSGHIRATPLDMARVSRHGSATRLLESRGGRSAQETPAPATR